jgi:hypothetical protein
MKVKIQRKYYRTDATPLTTLLPIECFNQSQESLTDKDQNVMDIPYGIWTYEKGPLGRAGVMEGH